MDEITVTLLSDIEGVGVRGARVTIKSSDFDEKLHLRAPEDDGAEADGEIAVLLADLKTQREDDDKQLTAVLDELKKPRRDDMRHVLEALSDDGGRSSGVRISREQPTHPLYRSMYRKNEQFRELRTPDLDHWGKQWVLALLERGAGNSVQRMAESREKLDEIYGARAIILVGDLDAVPTAITDGTGGSLLPQNMSALIEVDIENASVLGGIVRQLPMTSSTLRVVTVGQATADTVAEGADSSGAADEPLPASTMLQAHKIQSRMDASSESVDDSAFSIMSMFGSRAGRAIGFARDTQIATTDGVTPNFTGAIVGSPTSVEATITYLLIKDLFRLVPKSYRNRSVWLANNTTLGIIDEVLDGNGRPIFNDPTGNVAIVGDVPNADGNIFRRPVFEVPLVDGQLICGDPQSYVFARRTTGISVTVEQIFDTDTVGFRFKERGDGVMVDTVGLVQYTGITAAA